MFARIYTFIIPADTCWNPNEARQPSQMGSQKKKLLTKEALLCLFGMKHFGLRFKKKQARYTHNSMARPILRTQAAPPDS